MIESKKRHYKNNISLHGLCPSGLVGKEFADAVVVVGGGGGGGGMICGGDE